MSPESIRAIAPISLLLLIPLMLPGCSHLSDTTTAGPPPTLALPSAWTPTASTPRSSLPPDHSLPSPTPTPESPARLSSVGPWTAGVDDDGSIWVANADGSGRTVIPFTAPNQAHPAVLATSPDTAMLAFSTSPHDSHATDSSDQREYALYLVRLPDTSPRLITTLFSQLQLDYIASHFPVARWWDVGSANFIRASIAYAITWPRTLSWSPDGRYLAYVAAIDGPSTDLYVFDTTSSETLRLSYGASFAVSALWSPDGRQIIHQAVDNFNLGRSGATDISSLWASSLDGTEPRLLLMGPGLPLGWVSDSLMLAVLDRPLGCGSYNLVLVDVLRGHYTTLWRGGLWFDDPYADDYSFEIPSPSQLTLVGTLDPTFLRDCPPPSNPSPGIDPGLVSALPVGLIDGARIDPILVRIHHGQVTFHQP